MLSAVYNVAASPETRAIDAALAIWGNWFPGSALFQIEVLFNSETASLASAGPRSWATIGTLPDGRNMVVSGTTAQLLTGVDPNRDAIDIRITINPTFDWHFGSMETTPANQYSLERAMLHELGHAFFMTAPANHVTPFQFWAEDDDRFGGYHFAEPGPLMFGSMPKGPGAGITAADMEAASNSGIATAGDDILFLAKFSTAQAFGGAGDDTAIWLGTFDDFATPLADIETLELWGDNALTQGEVDLYRLYAAAFDREPDLAGFQWWADSGQDIPVVAIGFAGSAEFVDIYDPVDRSSLIEGLYFNVLGREPEPGGLDYWFGRVDLSVPQLLTEFALVPENIIGSVAFQV